MAPFVYQSLAITQRQIRVIDLLPGEGRIRCDLRHVSLTDKQEVFEALSYCWGPPRARKVKISMNNQDFHVKPNLHAALLRLRPKTKDARPRTLWIDAICINQSDTDERNSQVPLMGIIYSSCQRAIVWLGEHDPFTKSAFEGLGFMASRSHEGHKFNYYEWRPARKGGTRSVLQRVLLNGRVENLWSGATFIALFSRPWFKRVWVVQEVALSPHTVVMCGRYQIDWEVICKAHAVSKTNFEVHDHLGALLRFQNWPTDVDNDMFGHLIMALHKDATDPRDKLYGFMGLDSGQTGEPLITADYNAEAPQVFIDFTRAYLGRSGNLQVLAICKGCRQTAEPEYPCWAVDYCYDRSTEPLPHELISWGFRDWKAYPQGIHAGGVTPSRPAFAGNLLGLSGFPFDTVASLSEVNAPTPRRDGRGSATGRVSYWTSAFSTANQLVNGEIASYTTDMRFCWFYLEARKMCTGGNLGEIYSPTGQKILEAFWQLICGREPPPGHQDAGGSRTKLFEVMDKLLVHQAGRAATLRAMASITSSVIREPPNIEFFALVGITKQRRFLITEKGYMGLGPRETQVGDRIVILQGHRAPIVARQVDGGRWRVVGDSLIHGIMEGEAFSEEKCGMMWVE